MPKIFPEPVEQLKPAPFLRRMAAILYDGLISVALMMVTTGIYMGITAAIVGVDKYRALSEAGKTANDPLLSSVLFITLFLFFAIFWTKTGQTLGMQVWHIRIQNTDGSSIRWLQALIRFMMAWVSFLCLGLGYVWILFDSSKMSWQDRVSDSIVMQIPKRY
jgi:uncharacterized RDD family membrane protein YckC